MIGFLITVFLIAVAIFVLRCYDPKTDEITTTYYDDDKPVLVKDGLTRFETAPEQINLHPIKLPKKKIKKRKGKK